MAASAVAAAVLFGTVTGTTGSGWAAAVPGSGDAIQAGAPATGRATVTLITGDRVTVRTAGDGHGITVEPGQGRRGKGIRFRHFSSDGHVYVIPSDVVGEIASGKLDRRLFDVTGLVKLGYDDTSRDNIPLIVSYGAGGARTMSGIEGAATTMRLPAVEGAAVTLAKSAAAEALPRLRSGRIEQVWLDGKSEVLLDESVPQIGAPQAWEAGYTGAGVKVAVLDSGVDTGHPDLDDAVTAAEDFTGEGPGDRSGHGTHVASIIRGSGDASDGAYQGVAPEAELVSGKVCDVSGYCQDSSVLAGMAWAAVDQGADVVNLSLGDTDTPGTDPLEAAVDNLTEETGALFVIAAGNSGPSAGSVASPATADSALAVGSVDRSDQLDEGSGHGPRVGDGGIKPDVTAPGVDITAARAEGTQIGEPVGDSYVTISGTSMATPHVAGAAAILAQRHPDWAAGELKAVLMGSARPDPELTAFDQGAGRIDVERAIDLTVYAIPGSLSFGQQLWPHSDDEPVTKPITYRNTGKTDLTLDLSVTLAGPDGKAAPEGAASLSKDRLTVPAGGEAAVDLTLDTSHGRADGLYVGQVTATGDAEVVTPISVEKEIESYDLTIKSIDRSGAPAGVDVQIVGLGEELFVESFSSDEDTMTMRLPGGDYFITAYVSGGDGDKTTVSHLVQPRFTLDSDTTWTADGREAKPFSVQLEREDAELLMANIGFSVQVGEAPVATSIVSDTLTGIFTAQIGPSDDALTAAFSSQWGRPGKDGSFFGSPYLYGLVDTRVGEYWNGYHKLVRDKDLARVRTKYAAQSSGRLGTRYLSGWGPGMVLAPAVNWRFSPPAEVDLYLSPGDGVRWSSQFLEYVLDDEGSRIDVTSLSSTERGYESGRTYSERWNAAVFGPALDRAHPAAERIGSDIFVDVPLFGDGNGHAGYSQVDSASTVLYRDGEQVAESEWDGYVEAYGLPAEEAEFVLEATADRRSVSELSGRQSARWTFRSGATDEATPLPLLTVRFQPRVDDRNINHDGRLTLVPVTVESPPGAGVGKVRRPKVEVSVDDGSTWSRAPLIPAGNNTWAAVVRTPGDAEHVSFRASAHDDQGNAVEQTILRAFRLA